MDLTPGTFTQGGMTQFPPDHSNKSKAGKWRCRFQYVNRDRQIIERDVLAESKQVLIEKVETMKRLIAETEGGGIDGAKTGLHALAEDWLDTMRPEWSTENYRKYCEAVSFIRRQWPNLPIGEYRNDPGLLKRHNKVAGRQAQIAVRTLKLIFEHAVDQGYLGSNPARKLKALPYEKGLRRGLLPTEVEEFLAGCATADERFANEAPFVIGTRLGETLGLQRDDLDVARGMLRIARKVPKYADGRTALKTPAGLKRMLGEAVPVRLVKLDPAALALFVDRIAYLDATGYTGPWLIPNADRTGPWDLGNFRKRMFNRVLKRVQAANPKFKKFVPHETRHTHISYRMILGEPGRDDHMSIGMELGQASSSVTDEYAHYIEQRTPELQKQVGKVLRRAFCTGETSGEI